VITIYWGNNLSSQPEGIRVEPPISILQKMIQERIPKDLQGQKQYNRCPAFVDELKNLYGMKPVYDYTLRFEKEDGITSPDYDEEFFNSHFGVKSSNLFEFYMDIVFFTDEPSLEMSLIPAYLEDNNIVNSTIMIPGKIDIGKYFRGLIYAFHLKQNCNEIIFNRNEIYFYVKFHTKKKIQFKQFLWTPEITQMDRIMMAAKNYKYDLMNLDYYYNIFKRFNFKKKILKNIKENLCTEI
jgi:hypothetical protein